MEFLLKASKNQAKFKHCVKSVQIRSYFCSGKMRTRNNSVFGHFSRSESRPEDYVQGAEAKNKGRRNNGHIMTMVLDTQKIYFGLSIVATVSHLVHYSTLFQNTTAVITKCNKSLF